MKGCITQRLWRTLQRAGPRFISASLLSSKNSSGASQTVVAGGPLSQPSHWQHRKHNLPEPQFLCIGKVFFYDLRNLETLFRILSFVGLGLVLLLVSWIYTRFKDQMQKYL